MNAAYLRLASTIAAVLAMAITPSHSSPRKLRVGYLPATHDALLFIALDLGLFDTSKIEVKAIPYDNSVMILSDLKTDILDIGIPGLATPATDIGARSPLSIIGGAAARSAAIVTSPALALAIKSRTTVSDKLGLLKAKRVGAVRGSTGLAVFRQGLQRARLSEADVAIREYSRPSDILSDVLAGSLDAGLVWSPYMTLAIDRGLDIAIWTSEIMQNHVCCRQVARDAILNDGAAITAYLVGLIRAEQVLRKATSDAALRNKVAATLRKYITTLSNQQIEAELFGPNPRTTVTHTLDPAGIERYLRAMEDSQLMRSDQCDNVRRKIRTDFIQGAYQQMGCTAKDARRCVDSSGPDCGCANLQ